MIWLHLGLLISGIIVAEPYVSPDDALVKDVTRHSFTLNQAAFASWSDLLHSWNSLVFDPCFLAIYNHTRIISGTKVLIYVDFMVSLCREGFPASVLPASRLFDSVTVIMSGNNSLILPLFQLKPEQPVSTRRTVLDSSAASTPNFRNLLTTTLGEQSANWEVKSAEEVQTMYEPPCQLFLVAVYPHFSGARLVWYRDTAHYAFKSRRRHQFHLELLEPPHVLHSIIVHYDLFLTPFGSSSPISPVLCYDLISNSISCSSPVVLSSHTWRSRQRRLSTADFVSKGFKIMSYNIWNVDSGPHWDRRLPVLAKTIREENPDIVGLQEIRHEFADGLNQLSQLQALLPEYHHHFQPAQVERTQEEGLGFLSKSPLLNISYALLPITQSADLTQRICLHTAVEYGSSHLSFFVTHLAFVALPQLRQAGAVMKFMNSVRDSLHYPQSIVGDWNFYPESPEIPDYLVGNNPMRDPEYPSVGDLTEAFQPFDTWPTWEPLLNRPDRIYFRNGVVSNCSFPRDDACWARISKVFANLTYRAGFTKEPGNHNAVASDHLAVITTLQTCDVGYQYSFDASFTIPRNRTTFGPLAGVSGCVPACIRGCPANSTCIKPDMCDCEQGFRLVHNRSCVMDCGCRGHGKCISPTECLCDPGYSFNANAHGCEVLCPFACGLHSECVANNTCACSAGFTLVDQTCEPLCPPCRAHSFCAEPGVCACELGFSKNGTECVPTCIPECGSYSKCLAPNVCRSELGLIVFLLLFALGGTGCLLAKVFLRNQRQEYMPVAGLELKPLASRDSQT